jgi:predicted DNA-binding transcriptional regulator YafY
MDDPSNFDVGAYSEKMFGMFDGEDRTVEVLFDNSLISVVIDRFGLETQIRKTDENHFTAYLKVVVSPVFLSWIFQFGNMAKILSPDNVTAQFKNLLKEANLQPMKFRQV